eukprot:3230847-Rhodomonas_salina.1
MVVLVVRLARVLPAGTRYRGANVAWREYPGTRVPGYPGTRVPGVGIPTRGMQLGIRTGAHVPGMGGGVRITITTRVVAYSDIRTLVKRDVRNKKNERIARNCSVTE